MQLALMNVRARLENKGPILIAESIFHTEKKKLSHYLKIAPLMHHEQRAVSLKRPNSFYF